MKLKFSHVSDCHLGAWRKESLNKVGYEAFRQMIEKIIEERVDFTIISGDLYDVSNPKVDVVDFATAQLKRLKDANIPVYGIMGSHDFSPSGKSMIRPLMSAELFTNVSNRDWIESAKYPLRLLFTEDEKTQIKLTGMRARKRSLELEDYGLLDRTFLEQEAGVKIFVLHTMLTELKPKEYEDMGSGSKSLLPRNFAYYAGGHLHKTVPEKLRDGSIIIKKSDDLQKKVIYPGSLYPTNFLELERFEYGGFCIVSGDIPNGDLRVEYIPLKIKDIGRLYVDGQNRTIPEVQALIDEEINNGTFQDKIVAVRIEGKLSSGKPHEIKSNEIVEKIKEKGAHEVFVNKTRLTTEEYEKVSMNIGLTNDELEERLIREHSQKSDIIDISKEQLENKIHQLIETIGQGRHGGGKVKDYDAAMIKAFYEILDINMEDMMNEA